MAPSPDLDARGLIDRLDGAGVRYIVIGGVAAAMIGSPSLTMDLDICHATDEANVEVLASMLAELHARPRGALQDTFIDLDARSLVNGDVLTFVTDMGDLDVVAMPRGTYGYDDLARDAANVEIGGRKVLVASVDDLIRMKRAAGRPKDLVEIEILGALREEAASYG